MSTVEWLTIGTAVLGAVLGLINFFQGISRKKINLRVTPQDASPVNCDQDARELYQIEVVNLSEFPVMIAEIGFLLKNKNRIAVNAYFEGFESPEDIPCSLESRCAYSFTFDPEEHNLPWENIKSAYVRTQCGKKAYGSTPSLVNRINEARGMGVDENKMGFV